MRKVYVVLLMLIMSASICGCSNPVKEFVNEQKEEHLNSVVAKSRNYTMSGSSAKMLNDIDTNNKNINSLTSEIKDSWFPWHPFKMAKLAKMKSANMRLKKDYEGALRKDKVYQQSLKGVKADKKKSGVSWYIIVAVILAVLVGVALLVFLGKKKSTTPTVDSEQEDFEPTNKSGSLEVDYDKLLAKTCDKAGISTDEAINVYGSPRTAYERLNQLVAKGMSADEIRKRMSNK